MALGKVFDEKRVKGLSHWKNDMARGEKKDMAEEGATSRGCRRPGDLTPQKGG